VPSLRYSDRAARDLVRIAELLAKEDSTRAPAAVARVIDAIRILERHPLVGRVADDPLRELIISYGRSGYIALYRYDARRDRVLIKAIRHQREVGFEEP
jgi:plasmid stabilization system protein ParE